MRTGALGILFLRVRVTEIDQHAIAHELGDIAVKPPHRFAHHLLIGAVHIAHILGIEPPVESRGRPRQVAEHHGQMAPLGPRQVTVRAAAVASVAGQAASRLPQGR